MSKELMAMNESKAVTTLTCKVDVKLKGNFMLLADEKGKNVNQLLSIIVKEAVDMKHELQFSKLTDEKKKLLKENEALQVQLSGARASFSSENATTKVLNNKNLILESELKIKSNEIAGLKTFHEKLKSDNVIAGTLINEWKAEYAKLKSAFNESENKRSTAEKKWADLLRHNTEVIKKLKKVESENGNIRKWVWAVVNEITIDTSEVNVTPK